MTSSMLDQLACAKVLGRLFHRLDSFDYPGVAAQFSESCEWHRQGKVLRSHADIIAALQLRPKHLFVQHILHDVVCDPIDDTRMSGFAYMSVFRKEFDSPPQIPLPAERPDMLISWKAEFERQGDQWRITHLSNTALYR
jgi:hypothetical protein